MRPDTFKNEAEECRRQAATAFAGKPEGRLLLQLAGAFDELRTMRSERLQGAPRA
ncbi:MAG: hypothetical protein ABI770_08690 [Sphingomicrobium sp.]